MSSNYEINTTIIGTGTLPLVLLHGWGQSLQALMPLGEILSSIDRKIILMDLPGFGASKPPFEVTNDGGGWGTEQYASAVKNKLESLGVTRCVLLGHSFGGRICVRLASGSPELVEKLILVATHGIPRTRSLVERLKSFPIRIASTLCKFADRWVGTKLFASVLVPRIGSRDYLAAGQLRKTLVKTVNENLSSLAATIAVPTLLLWGTKDTETPIDIARRYNMLIKNSKLLLLEGKGHEPFKDVGAHLLAYHIEHFLASNVEVVK
jgi:pimeloyl-ACP methyl ester carboxylesterase